MEALITQLVKALGWSILHSLWQGAIIYALLFGIFLVIAGKTSKLKHNVAFFALAGTFISFCVTFFFILELPDPQTKKIGQTAIQYMFLQVQHTPNLIAKAEAYFPVLALVYFIGLCVQSCLLLSGYVKLKKLKKNFLTAIPLQWESLFRSTLAKLDIRTNVAFYLSEKVNVPLVIGFFKPVILFPVALAAQLDIKHVEAILIHELSHIRRNDYLLNLIKTTVEILMFFNPFVWLMTKLINVERENSCDDLVVTVTQTPLTYAHALLNIELLKNKNTPALSLAATGDHQHLYERIKRITNMKTNYFNMKQHALVLTLAMTTVLSLAWINPTKKTISAAAKTKINTLTPPVKNVARYSLSLDTDSTKAKDKVKIVITDKNGNESVYHKVSEVPDSIKKIMFNGRELFPFDSTAFAFLPYAQLKLKLDQDFNSPEFQSKMEKFGKDMEKYGKDMEAKFASPEYQKKMEKMGKEIQKKFDSPEFKAKMERIGKEMEQKFNSPEFKLKIKEMTEKYESPEFQAKMTELAKQQAELADVYSRQFNTEAFKKKMGEASKKSEELKKLYNSEDYKKLRQQYEKDLERLKKKNGISSDQTLLNNTKFLYDSSNSNNFVFANTTTHQPARLAIASADAVKALVAPIAEMGTTLSTELIKVLDFPNNTLTIEAKPKTLEIKERK